MSCLGVTKTPLAYWPFKGVIHKSIYNDRIPKNPPGASTSAGCESIAPSSNPWWWLPLRPPPPRRGLGKSVVANEHKKPLVSGRVYMFKWLFFHCHLSFRGWYPNINPGSPSRHCHLSIRGWYPNIKPRKSKPTKLCPLVVGILDPWIIQKTILCLVLDSQGKETLYLKD